MTDMPEVPGDDGPDVEYDGLSGSLAVGGIGVAPPVREYY